MTTITPVPIDPHWTTSSPSDEPQQRRVSAREVALTLGSLPVADLANWQSEIAAVAAELASAAAISWPFGHQDPTIVLLRALGRLAIKSPDTTSTLGVQLLEALPEPC